MTKLEGVVLFLMFVVLSQGQDSLNSQCEQRDNLGHGVCVVIFDCKDPKPTGLPICGFQGNTPLVCCSQNNANNQEPIISQSPHVFIEESTSPHPTVQQNIITQKPFDLGNRVGNRISEKKCKQYAEEVTTTVTALLLTPSHNPVVQKVPKCDYKNVRLIVGGEQVEVGEFPHMVALGYGVEPAYEFNCGGTLISERFVMTAAHCVSTSNYGDPVIARLGEHDLQSTNDGANPIDVEISQIIVHPEYKPPRKYNDLALLKLSRDIRLSSKIRPACLPTKSPPSDMKAVATGWGKIQYSEEASPVLLKVVIPLIEENKCSQLWSSSIKISASTLPRGIDHTSMLCAGDLTNGGKDTCLGDSGGPLSIASTENECVHYIVGVTSFGKYCGFRNSPGIYTRVSNYVPWIESIVWPGEQ